MPPEPRKFSTDDALYTAALRALVRRGLSVHQMRLYLERRADDPASVPRVLSRLREEKMLDDARYALEFARSRVNVRRQGQYRIARELRQRGVPDRHIADAIAAIFAEHDETALVRKVIERRLRAARAADETRARPLSSNSTGHAGAFEARAAAKKLADKKLASLYRTLLRAGFDPAVIRREVANALRGAAITSPELPPGELPPEDSPSDEARVGGFPDEEA